MPLDTTLSVRLDSEDLPLLNRVLEYRFKQVAGDGMKKPELGEYLRYLINQDIQAVMHEIATRRA